MKFSAHGKLLLSAEYFVLDGAKALAVPLKRGQELTVTPNNTGLLNWQSFNEDDVCWFNASFNLPLKSEQFKSSNSAVADKLIAILKEAQAQNLHFLQTGFDVQVRADFNLAWGMGSSSTLVSLIAQWAKVNPYPIQFKCFGGSAYDIACAQAKGPIIYQKNEPPIVQPVDFNQPFISSLYLAYLGTKQNSREGIAHYKGLSLANKSALIKELDQLTSAMLACKTLSEFAQLLKTHEQLIATHLKLVPIAKKLTGVSAQIKSLGAWGGDFVLLASFCSEDVLRQQLSAHGIDMVFRYSDLVR